MKKLIRMTSLAGAVLISGCFAVHRPLVNPKVDIPAHASSTQVQQAIRHAFAQYGWTVDKEEPGVTTAHLQQEKLYAGVRVEYDDKLATIKYVETKNFWHEKSADGQEMIHSRYLVWVRNIEDSIREQLSPKSPKS